MYLQNKIFIQRTTKRNSDRLPSMNGSCMDCVLSCVNCFMVAINSSILYVAYKKLKIFYWAGQKNISVSLSTYVSEFFLSCSLMPIIALTYTKPKCEIYKRIHVHSRKENHYDLRFKGWVKKHTLALTNFAYMWI